MRVLVPAMIALLLVGCGSGDGSAPDPEHATSSPSASSSPSPPSMPRAAKDDTDSGAIAFVKHYVDVLNYAAVTGDTDELKRLSSPKCEGCQEYIDLYEKTYADGGYFKGGEWELSNIEIEASGKATYVFARMSAESSSFKKDESADPSTGVIEDIDLVFGLKHKSGTWMLGSFEYEDE